jgi:hypothetical protein
MFRTLAYGQYAETHLQDTIDKDDMQKFVDGAVWAYDFIKKNKLDQTTLFVQSFNDVETISRRQDQVLC